MRKNHPSSDGRPSLDAIDVRLLDAVQGDARLTLEALAERCALSTSSVARRLRALEAAGIIEGYAALVSPQALGYGQDVFVEVSLHTQSGASMDQFESAVAGLRQVLSCWLMSGEFDYLLRVVARDPADYEQVHRALSKLPGVLRIRSSFALRQVLWRQLAPAQV